MRATRVESPRSTREHPEPFASFEPVSAITIRDGEGRSGPREGFATCSRLRAVDRSAHITISCSRMAAHRKQLAAWTDGFCWRRVSHLLACPVLILLFRHAGHPSDDRRAFDCLAEPTSGGSGAIEQTDPGAIGITDLERSPGSQKRSPSQVGKHRSATGMSPIPLAARLRFLLAQVPLGWP
jgi:hypothetical protein